MPRCDFCSSLSFEKLRDNDIIEFKPNIAALEKSVLDDCDFCRLCWESLKIERNTDDLHRLLRESPNTDGTSSGPILWLVTYMNHESFDPPLCYPAVYVSWGKVDPIHGTMGGKGIAEVKLRLYA